MQRDILLKVHKNHLGAASNVRMAKQVLFWPGMSQSISDMCNSCEQCAKYQCVAPKEPMKSLPIPYLPWQIISQDLFELEQKSYLVTVCHFSDWIEVDALPDTLSATVINATKAHFARYGIPRICHTDNGPQFISKEYQAFASSYHFKHTKSFPYHPQGNGRAEAAVKVVKSMFKKSDDFHAALLNYRNTPQQGHTYSPAQRIMNHRTRTLLPTSNVILKSKLVDTDIVFKEISQKRANAKHIYDRKATVEHVQPTSGSFAYAKPPPQRRGQPWIYGKIIAQDNSSYTIQTPQRAIRRNRIHIRPATAPSSPLVSPVIRVYQTPVPSTKPTSSQASYERVDVPTDIPTDSPTDAPTDTLIDDV